MNGKTKYIGVFADEKVAAVKYNETAILLGINTVLNNIERGEAEYLKCEICGKSITHSKRLDLKYCKDCQNIAVGHISKKKRVLIQKRKNCTYKRQWALKNKERLAECQKRYRTEHKEELSVYSQQYYQENKDKIAEYKRQYYRQRKDTINKLSVMDGGTGC